MRLLLRDLVRPRYAALTALMVAVALICVVAGSWQILRYDGKHLANDDLRANADDTPVAVAQVLPLARTGTSPAADDVEFRSVTATGSYDTGGQVLMRRQQVDDTTGYVVLTPLRTGAAVVLVARGFVADTTLDLRPAEVPSPPTGEVTVTGRVEVGTDSDDKFAALGNGQVEVVNPSAIAARLGTAVYAGYVELAADQPGTAGLTALPGPDLSNPAGGAFELQHLAYVVQWYLFAGLALAAPVVMVRTDRKRAREDAEARAAALAAAPPRAPGKELVPVNPRLARARTVEERLAERYGR